MSSKVTTQNKKNNKKKKKKSPIRRIIKFILLLALIVATVYGVIFIYKVQQNGGGLSGILKTAMGHNSETKKNLGVINILLLGESGVGDGYNLADSIMICSYNPNLQQAAILSIPRDTYVGKRNKDEATSSYLASYKMNAVYRNGTNIDETLECVSNLTGLDLEYYILINTDAVIKMVDAVGGITFNVPIDMDYDDLNQDLHIHLKAGEQLIDGPKAEQLLRFRHNNDYTTYPVSYGDNDYGRMRTQREFMQEAAKQILQPKNIFKVKELLDIAFDNVKTNLDLKVLKDYVPYAVEFDSANIKTEVLPGESELCNEIWIFNANKIKTKKIVKELFEYKIEDVKENSNNIKVEILNGTSDTQVVENLSQRLALKGFEIVSTSKNTQTQKTIIIKRTEESHEEEQELKNIFGISKISSSLVENATVDYTIIIGQDYLE